MLTISERISTNINQELVDEICNNIKPLNISGDGVYSAWSEIDNHEMVAEFTLTFSSETVTGDYLTPDHHITTGIRAEFEIIEIMDNDGDVLNISEDQVTQIEAAILNKI